MWSAKKRPFYCQIYTQKADSDWFISPFKNNDRSLETKQHSVGEVENFVLASQNMRKGWAVCGISGVNGLSKLVYFLHCVTRTSPGVSMFSI